MPIKSACAVFLKNLKIRGCSPNTLRSYTTDLGELCAFFNEIAVDKIEIVDLEILRAFISKLVDSGIKKTTISRKISVIKAFFTFLYTNSYIDKNPSVRVRYPKAEKNLPSVLSPEQVRKMLDFVQTALENARDDTPENYANATQNLALLEILYSSGLRIQEALNLQRDDVDFAHRQLRVSGKGGKVRVVPFNQTAGRHLAELVKLRANSTALFLSGKNTPLGVRDAYRIVHKIATAVGIPGVHPHTLRHSMATHMIDNNADIRIVQEILGHSSITTTQKYLHISTKKLQSIYAQAFPRA
jgi:integrase/recombinase XerC